MQHRFILDTNSSARLRRLKTIAVRRRATISPDILLTQPQSKNCIAALKQRFTLHSLIDSADPDALLNEAGGRIRAIAGGKVNEALIDKLPKLEIIAHSGVGTDSIDLKAAKARGVRVTNTPDVLNDAVAELTIGLMLALARRLPQADRYIRDGEWSDGMYPLTGELNGKTLGILGLGRIGKEIARRAEAMKMKVVYHGRNRQPDQAYAYYADLTEMARDVDWLVLIAPSGRETEGIVSRQVIEALGQKGMLVNMARGSLVEEPALVELLTTGALGGAALDVFAKEPAVPEALLGLDNVVLSPHQGSRTLETRDAVGRLVVANLDAHFSGKPLISPVV